MHLEHFGGGEDRRDRSGDTHPDMGPGVQEIPWPTPSEDKTPDISPAKRQEIIDDMNQEDTEEERRQRRIEEIIRERNGN